MTYVPGSKRTRLAVSHRWCPTPISWANERAKNRRILAALSERDSDATVETMADHSEAVKKRALIALENASMVSRPSEES